MPRKYQKPPLSISEQANLLIERGLICDDRTRFESYLASIGYYRLSAYWYPYIDQSTQKFFSDTNFNTILDIYIFDRKLRLLVMEAIERIEVALRAQWSRECSLSNGSHAYMNSSFFKNRQKHVESLKKITKEINRSKETSIQHYKDSYCNPVLPPIWTIVEIMTFGELSHWFENTNDTQIKKSIIKAFNIPTIEILESIFHALTPLRNVCTHHSRLWNRKFVLSLPHIKNMSENLVSKDSPNQQAKYLYNYLVVIEHLMRSISPNSQWKFRLIELLDTLDSSNHQSMGFPDDWQSRKSWCKNN